MMGHKSKIIKAIMSRYGLIKSTMAFITLQEEQIIL